MMWLAKWELRRTRAELYRSLQEKLDLSGGAAPEKLDQIFGAWAARDRRRSDIRAPAMSYLHRKLSDGVSLSNALRPFVSADEALILEAGDIQGNLSQALGLVLRNMQAQEQMRDSVRSAMAQPLVGFLSILALSVVSGLWMWPDVLRSIPIQYWPRWCIPLIDVQLWIADRWLWLAALAPVFVVYHYSLDRWTGPLRTRFDRLPPWSIHRGEKASSLLGILAALVESGRTVRESLVLMRSRSQPYMRWRISQIINRYDASGEDGLSALQTGFFSQGVMDRIEDAASNRSFGQTLRHVGGNALKLIIRSVHRQAEVANVFFLSIVGLAIIYTTMVALFGMYEATATFTKAVGG